MRHPVTYSGAVKRTRALEDRVTHETFVAIELTRSERTEEGVLVLCGANKERKPACGTLRTLPESGRIIDYVIEDGIVEVRWADRRVHRFVVFL
jgi:hypothetical protein